MPKKRRRIMTRFFMFMVVFVTVAFVSINTPPSLAQAEEAAVNPAVQVALDGRTLCEEGNYEEGINILQEGYRSYNEYQFLLYTAICYQAAHEPCESADFFSQYLGLESDPEILPPEMRREIEEEREVQIQDCAALTLVNNMPEPEPEPEPEMDEAMAPSLSLRRGAIASFVIGGALTITGAGLWGGAWAFYSNDPYELHPHAVGDGYNPMAVSGDVLVPLGLIALGVGTILEIIYQRRFRRWEQLWMPTEHPPPLEEEGDIATIQFQDWRRR